MRHTLICLLAGTILLSLPPTLPAQEYGKLRALERRSEQVLQQRNDFVSQVLTAYAIPYRRNEKGIVMAIRVEDRWLNVQEIEIVPLIEDAEGRPRRVAAHRLFFQTDGGVLELLSELTIR